MKKTPLILWFAVAILIALFLGTWHAKSDLKKQNNRVLISLSAELVTWKDKDSLQNAKIIAIETEKAKTFLDLATKDAKVISLQKEVTLYKKQLKEQGSVTNITTITSADTTVPTVVTKDSLNPYPIYTSKIDLNGWILGDIKATKDSTRLTLKVKNEYTVIIGRDPQGFLGLGKSIPFAQVKNKNPYSETIELRTYTVSLPKAKHFSVGPLIGYGFVEGFKFQPIIGIGIQYTIFKF